MSKRSVKLNSALQRTLIWRYGDAAARKGRAEGTSMVVYCGRWDLSFRFVSCYAMMLKIDAVGLHLGRVPYMACDVRRAATAFYPHNVCGRGRAAFDTQHMRYAARLFGGSSRRKVSPAIEDSANRRGGQSTYCTYARYPQL